MNRRHWNRQAHEEDWDETDDDLDLKSYAEEEEEEEESDEESDSWYRDYDRLNSLGSFVENWEAERRYSDAD